MIGETLAHYRILDQLGAGGMGEVYLADDTTLHRRIALKVLPPELAESPERLERFEREARTLAALDHPNIVTIHSVEEADGVRFLTMAYVEGETLGELIPPQGLPLERFLELALPLAEGLRAAHDRGIVHRDLKPGNVMVDRAGRLRILDFGLAKLQPEAAPGPASHLATETLSPEMTREGSILGTYPYMSPEQAEGKPADARSDVFSLGSVLYEMATGVRPFTGGSPAALVSSILKDRPRPITAVRPDLPPRLGAIVERCLAKDPGERYRTAAEVREAVAELADEAAAGKVRPASRLPRAKTWQAVAVAAAVVLLSVLLAGLWLWRGEGAPPAAEEARIDSIAVLPLRNLSGDPEQEYFADGMTEALITDLSKIGALKVISRASAMRFKGTERPVAEIAAELGVDALIQGSVVREGDRVGITTQLTEAASGQNLWAERYERGLTSVLKLQGEIARAVARQVEVALTPDEERRLTETREVDPKAYEAYLKGTFHLNKLTPEGIEQGLAYLHQAVEEDPGSALAYAGLALGYSLVASHSPSPPPDAFQRAQAAYRKALELDENLAEAHAAVAETKLYREWDWDGAERAFRRALELNPNLPRARAHYAHYLGLFGRQDEAVAEMRRAKQVDPLDPLWTAWIGDLHVVVGHYDQALSAAREALELDPDFPWGFLILGWSFAGQGEYEEAIAAHRRAAELEPRWRSALGITYAKAGRREQALEIAAELEDPFFLSQLHGALGDRDAALRWIEIAIEQRHPFAPWAFREIEFVELMRGDPRYRALRKQMGIPAPEPVASSAAA